MKKMLFFAMVILLVAGIAIAKTSDTPITSEDLPGLKGAWTGERLIRGRSQRTDLNINNDSLPLKGDITLHYQQQAPKTWPFTGQIEDGRLKLSFAKENGSADLSLRKKDDGSMELKGTIAMTGGSTLVEFKQVK